MSPASISIVIVNWNGWQHLRRCLQSVAELDYPAELLETLVVDNGSTDGSAESVRAEFPNVRLVRNPTNVGFGRANNRAAALASGKFLALLNNDAVAGKGWLREAVEVAETNPASAAVASQILSWEGDQVLFRGGGMNFHGVGFQRDLRAPRKRNEDDVPTPTLFACGAAMLIDRHVFLEVGGFDDDYFAYYEDVDLGWRLWVLGYKVAYAPRSTVYHRHSATSRKLPRHQLRVLQLRNPLLSVLKNYEDANLRTVLPAALLLSMQRTIIMANIDPAPFRVPVMPSRRWRLIGHLADWGSFAGRTLGPLLPAAKGLIPRIALADLVAYQDYLTYLPATLEKRHIIQRRRMRRDADIFPLFHDPFWPVEDAAIYHNLLGELRDAFSLDALLGSTTTTEGRDPSFAA